MKICIFLVLAFSGAIVFAQEPKPDTAKSINTTIKEILKYPRREFTDKTCEQLLNDMYECLETDAGPDNPRMAMLLQDMNRFKDNKELANRQIALLLSNYLNAISEPQKAALWVRALKDEYYTVYLRPNPLILLYEGENMVRLGRRSDANAFFLKFRDMYPQSVNAACYVYETEPDKELARAWLKKLLADHPNHWKVKKYR